MRYLRKFTGDQITEEDICPHNNELRIDIPKVDIRPVKVTDIPIRIETRDSVSSNKQHSNRIFSSSLFDLVPEPSSKAQSSTSKDGNKMTPLCTFTYDDSNSPCVLKKESYDYTDIIQYYEENSPFNRSVNQHHASTSVPHRPKRNDVWYTENMSSPDTNSIVSSNSSLGINHENNSSSGGHSQEQVVGNSIHARDSIPYLRNYDGAPHSYRVVTNTPPKLPLHTVNVLEKDSYYRSKATPGRIGEPVKPISVADTSVYTRKPRVYRTAAPIKHRDDNEEHFYPYRPSGYHGNLRVIN